MAKWIKFIVNFYDNGIVKYEADKSYPDTEETRREMLKGNAVEVDVPDPEEEKPPEDPGTEEASEEQEPSKGKKRRKAADEV
jgi:hypothetical protein